MIYAFLLLLLLFFPGRYSPVRRASEGSKTQFQGPLQECQYLQKGIAQRNFLCAPSPPLLENSISLPGKPSQALLHEHALNQTLGQKFFLCFFII